jgi:hypothetical protein
MPDLEATYLAAASKGTAPTARSMSALSDWCVARGSAPRYDAQALYDFITGYATPGSATYASPGTYSFTVPYFASLTAAVNGAGGGGGGMASGGGTGGYSAFGGVIGYGGGGGATAPAGGTGAAGGATGGDSNAAGPGAAGGIGAYDQTSDKNGTYDSFAGNGGAGGLATKGFSPAELAPGSTIIIVVGSGGAPGSGAGNQRGATAGTNGNVQISWS